MTSTPSDPASPAASLPVVGYADTNALAANVADGYPYEYLTKDATHKRAEPLVRLSDASSQLSALREQVARLERERDAAYQQGLQVTRGDITQLQQEHAAELAALKASKAAPLDVERDAARWQTMRQRFVAVDWDWGGGDNGMGMAVALFEIDPTLPVFAGPECADAFADYPTPTPTTPLEDE